MAEIIKDLNNMLKKDSAIKWTIKAKQSFKSIKQALTKAPVLISPDYTKDFIIFSFASEHTIAAVLLQKKKTKVLNNQLHFLVKPSKLHL